MVLYEYRGTSKLDQISVLLYDPEYELRRILETEGIVLGDHPSLMFTENLDDLEDIYRYSYVPFLGPYRPESCIHLFTNPLHPPRSVALLPMMRGGEIIGSLHLGSHHEERFTNSSGSDFLQRLASIVGACLNNVTIAERLKLVGLTDVLTGVNNRRFFDQRIQEEVSAACRRKQQLCALFFDVDHFKNINDRFGHQAGDLVLREVAGIIRSQLRTSDVLARYGGEEFSALLVDTAPDGAVEIAERIRVAIADTQYQLSDGQMINVTISIGVSSLNLHQQNSDAMEMGLRLLQSADECLYDAKRNGRNRVLFQDM
jgi:diguanylate cyclase (GGDEF)-like protein